MALATQIFAAEASTICRNDLALVVFDPPLTDAPIYPVRLGRGNEHGEALRVVGYGVDEASVVGTRRTKSDLHIAQIGASDFRTPADADPTPPRTFVTDGPALCIGDSGGPAFADSGALTGVWSQVVGDCAAATARNVFTQVAPYEQELLEPALAAAGAKIWREGTNGPGELGGAPAEGTAGAANAAGEAPSSGGRADVGGAVPTSGGDGGEGVTVGSPLDGGAAGDEALGSRSKGGCRCAVVGGPASGMAFAWLPTLLAITLVRRRGAASRSGRVGA